MRYKEVFMAGGDAAAYTFELSLTARRINLDNKLHDNNWLDWMPHQ